MLYVLQLLSQVSLAQSNGTNSLSQSSQVSNSSASQTQAVLNSLQQTLSAASAGQNGITVQPASTRILTQNLNNTASSLNSSNTTTQLLGKISEIGASGHTNTAVNLANQILATRVTSTQLINHVPSSLEGLMPSMIFSLYMIIICIARKLKK
jgi:hypothetical protein